MDALVPEDDDGSGIGNVRLSRLVLLRNASGMPLS